MSVGSSVYTQLREFTRNSRLLTLSANKHPHVICRTHSHARQMRTANGLSTRLNLHRRVVVWSSLSSLAHFIFHSSRTAKKKNDVSFAKFCHYCLALAQDHGIIEEFIAQIRSIEYLYIIFPRKAAFFSLFFFSRTTNLAG